MRYLSVTEVIELHRRVVEQSGGSDGIPAMVASISNPLRNNMTSTAASAIRLMPSMKAWCEQVQVMLALAAGELNREQFTAWVVSHTRPIGV